MIYVTRMGHRMPDSSVLHDRTAGAAAERSESP